MSSSEDILTFRCTRASDQQVFILLGTFASLTNYVYIIIRCLKWLVIPYKAFIQLLMNYIYHCFFSALIDLTAVEWAEAGFTPVTILPSVTE